MIRNEAGFYRYQALTIDDLDFLSVHVSINDKYKARSDVGRREF